MRISETGITLLKRLEGSVKIGDKHVIYDDQTGTQVDVSRYLPKGATIGYGHLIKSGEDFTKGITEKQATELLYSDIAMAESTVNKNVIVPLTQNQYDALVIFAFNIGINNFIKSTVLKYINTQDFQSASYPNLESAWKAWNKSQCVINKGLINRRNTEWCLFTNGCIG